ncbi:MAG: hypothetical protein KME29_30055 [Calothrix sp. FI2-JRJ7]|jgi:hypothetical protein|nr:hypothetical protein [Calothrix sp. FI2-JRJ7]
MTNNLPVKLEHLPNNLPLDGAWSMFASRGCANLDDYLSLIKRNYISTITID